MAKQRWGRFSKEFCRMAVERMKTCSNITVLARELGVSRRRLYFWRERLEPANSGEVEPEDSRELTLRKEIRKLQRVLADKTLELDFFKGALQKVAARRQNSGMTGVKGSTTKSKK
jgi:transposase